MSKQTKHKLLIVEDHALTRAGLSLVLSQYPQYEVTQVLDRGAPVMPLVNSEDIDIVILDLDLPDMNGTNLLAELVGVHDLTVMVLTGRQNAKEFNFAVKMGARAVVSKADDVDCILSGLAAIAGGLIYTSPSVERALASSARPMAALSPRQMAILHYLSKGESNKEIGYRLGIAAPTVSFHMTELRRKLAAKNNNSILIKARELDLI